jgi:hypothetical protein
MPFTRFDSLVLIATTRTARPATSFQLESFQKCSVLPAPLFERQALRIFDWALGSFVGHFVSLFSQRVVISVVTHFFGLNLMI